MIAAVVVAVVLALACVGLVVALLRTRATARQAHEEIDAARAETAQTTAELETARGDLADARASAQAAADEAAGARADAEAARAEARAQQTEAAGARAAADAARAELAASRAASAAALGEGAAEGAAGEGAAGEGVFAGGAGAFAGTRAGGVGAGGVGAGGVGAGGVGAYAAPTLGALWSLARIRQEWLSRQVASLTLEGGHPEGAWAEVTLAEVLDEEVSRIREETGTPGALRTSLHEEPPAGQSMLLLAGVQALLEAMARHCQAYDLYVHLWEERLAAVVVCEGFDGPDRVASDTEAVLAAIAPAGGELALDRDQQGRLRARLSLPLHSTG